MLLSMLSWIFHNRFKNSSEDLINFLLADERMRLLINSVDIVIEKEILLHSAIVSGLFLLKFLFRS